MLRFMRTARIARGKEPQAMQWAKGLTEWINKKYDAHLSVYMDCFGEYGTLRWFKDYESLGDFETRMQRLLGDQEYLQWLAKGADLWIEGSIADVAMVSF